MGWQDAPIVSGPPKAAWESAPVIAPAQAAEKPGMLSNIGAGVASGVADLGDTLLNAAAYLPGKAIPAIKKWNDERSASLEDFNKEREGSTAFNVARVGGNVAATLPIGGVLGAGVKAVSAAPAVQAVGNAVASGGFRTGGGVGGAADIVARIVGGGAAGAATTAAVQPESAGAGALIGAALPGVVKGYGAVTGAILKKASKALPPKLTATPQALATARAGAAEGFVVPPVDLDKPGLMTQLLSGLSGKIKTSQVASQRNQVVTDGLARKALGMQATDDLTPDALQNVRREAGKAYEAVRGVGVVQADEQFLKRIDQIGAVSRGAGRSFPGLGDNGVAEMMAAVRQPKFDSGDAIDATQLLREAADKAFRGGDNTTGRAAKAAATALEDQIERHLTTAGTPELVKNFQDARKLIAKTYSVQAALNPTTGSVSAQKLAKDLTKGKPLSDELALIGKMGSAFPKAMQPLKESAGAVSSLDWLFSGMGGGNATGVAMLLGRPAVRSALLSKPVQAAAMREAQTAQAAQAIEGVMARALPLSYRAAPVVIGPASNP
ncbi:MAG: hypothetical protein ACRC7C_19900 [Beijerinckiaceae bacterium]